MQRKTRLPFLATGALALLVLAGVGLAVAHHGASAPLAWAKSYDARGFPRGGWAGFTDANGTVTGRFVTFQADPAAGTITDLGSTAANASHPLVASLQLGNGSATGSAAMRRGGGYLLDDGAGDRLAVGDTPLAGFQAMSRNGTTLTITLPAGATVATHDAVADWSPAGATVTYANGEKANLVLGRGSTLAASGQTLTVTLAAGSGAAFTTLPDAAAMPHGGFWHGFGHRLPFGGFAHRGWR